MGVFDGIYDWIEEAVTDEKWIMRESRSALSLNTDRNLRYDPPTCSICIAVNKCWFRWDKMPRGTDPLIPHALHPNCKCKIIPVSAPQKEEIEAFCDIRKFNEYIFAAKGIENGKIKLFSSWGYTINHSEMLKDEFEKQAAQQYAEGEYQLGKLDSEGQRINIKIELWSPYLKKIVYFVSGWMVLPNKGLSCNTPYGRKLK